MFWPLVEAQTSWFITFLILFWFLLSLFFYLCSGWMNEAVRNSLAESGLSRLCFGAARRVGLQTSFIFLLHHTTSVCLTEDDTNTFFHQWLARDNLNFKLMWLLFWFQVFKEWRTDVFEAWTPEEAFKAGREGDRKRFTWLCSSRRFCVELHAAVLRAEKGGKFSIRVTSLPPERKRLKPAASAPSAAPVVWAAPSLWDRRGSLGGDERVDRWKHTEASYIPSANKTKNHGRKNSQNKADTSVLVMQLRLTLWYGLLQPLQNWYRHWEQLKCMQPPLVRAYWNLQWGQAARGRHTCW